jgi:hypothetical protein
LTFLDEAPKIQYVREGVALAQNKKTVSQYLAMIGRRGGLKSRRSLGRNKAKEMVRVREAKKLFRQYYAECFWYCDPDLSITIEDVSWVAEQLMKNGSMECWKKGRSLYAGN